ncbi:ABC transporter ATP-binding protein [Desulfonatronum thioautotrophicum]|uniref:ABC transporter ATP-binding protein n=1 Tax=Desulfonatronum thioautotrophicum TaxID=617001 RepID=UPI00069A496B|nr:ABC transporter ATP-binding protein [Desulfonatronum thioautotrophicum]
MSPPALAVHNLVKQFAGTAAVDNVSFSLAENEFFTLLGPSGCGKTTTLRCVAGLEQADAGEIRIREQVVFSGRDGVHVPTNHRPIGMVFQSYAVWPHMTVFENIAYPLRVRGRPRSRINDRVAQVLQILDMPGMASRMPSQLSGGQQQRVALGRALAMNPAVLLLDEPLSNLDAKLRESMRAELQLVQRTTGLPILYVTHDQVEAMALSDRIAVMSGGRVLQIAEPEAIYERPSNRFVLDFIGAVNYLPCIVLERSGERLCLRAEDGTPLNVQTGSALESGRELLMAVRPEDLRLEPEGTPCCLPGTVALRSFLGNALEFRVHCHKTSFRVQTEKERPFQVGDRVALRLHRGLFLDHDDKVVGIWHDLENNLVHG